MIEPAEVGNLGHRTVRGMAWAYSTYVGERLIVLFATAVLGRLLTPSDFGIVAQAALFITLFETLSDLGLGQALVIADRKQVEERASAVFKYSVLIGLALAGLVAALGPAAAAFFDQPELVAILPVLGATLFIRSLGSTHYALAQKNLEFRRRTVAEMFDVSVRASVGITLALLGFAEWSLVLGTVAGAIAFTTTLWLVIPFRPHLRVGRGQIRGMLRFGGALTALDVLAAVIANVDYIFVGRHLGAAQLGIYTFGFKLPELLIINFAVVAGRVLLPAFAAANSASRVPAFVRSFHYTLLLCLPLTVVLAVMAEPIIRVAFGPQWLSSVPVMRAICVYALALAISIPAGTVYKATGHAGILVALAIPRAALVITAIAFFVDRGVRAVALCQAAVATLFAMIGVILAVRFLRVPARMLWRAAWTPVCASAVLAIVLVAVRTVVSNPLVELALAGLVGSAAYFSTLFVIDRQSLLQARDLARPPTSLADAPATETTS